MSDNTNDSHFVKLSDEQKAARKSRAIGILIAVLLFALLIYIATYAKFGV